uniref:zinc ribbon domain-containing protein n=1 Tax=Parolsenella massiliensis TaxID=1871022 RepID=UPI0009332D00|nr:zinc ribbon domain-containing protein [Parolsenella massiliensis]
MFCTNCGKQQPDGAKFCSNCGTTLAAPNQATTAPSNQVTTQLPGRVPPAAPDPIATTAPLQVPAAAPSQGSSATPGQAAAPAPGQNSNKRPERGRTAGIIAACVAILAVAGAAIFFITSPGKGEHEPAAPAPATTQAATTDAATNASTPAATADAAIPETSAAPSANTGEARADGDVSYTDPHYGFQLRLPGDYAITSDSSDGVVYSSTSSQVTVSAYATARQGETPENILSGYENNYPLEYEASGDTWCVASWKSDGYEYYDKYYVTDGYICYFSFKYPASAAQAGSDLIEAYIQYFKPGTE